jgi:hypothetical protein
LAAPADIFLQGDEVQCEPYVPIGIEPTQPPADLRWLVTDQPSIGFKSRTLSCFGPVRSIAANAPALQPSIRKS